jgi:tetratricopeptide (TPR) repeat protein
MPALDPAALPGFLLGLHREAFTGWLALRRQAITRRFQWQGGKPVRLESNQAREALVAQLVARGLLTDSDAERLHKQIASRGGDEIAAILASKRIPPKELLLALAQRVGDALADCLSWRDVEVVLEPDPVAEKPAPPLPLDLAAVLARGIAAHWRPDQVLHALGSRAIQFPMPGEAFDARRRQLAGDPAVDALLGAIDGRTAAYALPGATSSAAAAAALWVLDASGAIGWQEQADAAPAPQAEEASRSLEPEIEIVVAGRDAAAATDAGPAAADRKRARDDRAEELRKEVEDLHRRLGEIDYYALLGVERGANPAVVKRAYLKAAKRLHPDAVARAGLEELKTEANEVFAEITKAHGVLSDLEERRAYDASLEGHTALDAGRVAQAETLFRKGEVMMRAGNFRGALELLEGAVRIWPEEADYQAALAWTLTRKNPPEIDRALEHFEKALALGGEKPVWMLRMSIAVKEKGDADRAAQLAARARALDPGVRA